MKNKIVLEEEVKIVVKSTDMKEEHLEILKIILRKLHDNMGPFEEDVQEAAEKLKRMLDG